MKKKIIFLYACASIIILTIIGVLLIVYKNSNTNKKAITSENNEIINVWNYKKYETYNGKGQKIDNPYTLKNFSLIFYKEKVEVCYETCYTNKYTKKENILIINDSDYFSGKFIISYKDDDLILKNDSGELGSFVYYFSKPKGEL